MCGGNAGGHYAAITSSEHPVQILAEHLAGRIGERNGLGYLLEL